MKPADIFAMLDDAQTVTLTMLGEARGEEVEGRIAVGNVIRNRVNDDRWPDTFKDVCLQKMQFSCWQTIGGASNHKALMDLAERMLTGRPPNISYVSEALVRETAWVARGIISGEARDRTGGSNHYLTRKLWESSTPPQWARGCSPSCLILRHAFFRL